MKMNDKGCCVMHHLFKSAQENPNCILKLEAFLDLDKFSSDFKEFLCSCLRFDHASRLKI